MMKKFRIALAGNPNCGKTSIFNALTGARQHVGNYPGVTVESKTGSFVLNDYEIELMDLPGVYSLSSNSPEEEVVFTELTKAGIDLIVNVIDSTIPQRSLYLTTQLAELHIPMLLAFNMSDDAKRKGLKYDIAKLETYFGAPIVQTVGCRANGTQPLLTGITNMLSDLENHGMPMLSYGADIDDAIQAVSTKIDELNVQKYQHIPSRFFAIKLLEHDSAAMKLTEFKGVWSEVEEQIKHLKAKHAIEADTFMADRRYAMLAGACRDTISLSGEKRREISDKIDLVMTNHYLGLPIFLIIIYAAFWFTFTCAEPFMGYIETAFGQLADGVNSVWPDETMPHLRSMITDGIIGGVGGVLVFLPNILFLFFVIAILEDSGYMARAAFIMDGIMRRFGLQGRSFVPLVLGFGCTVPAIMATRVIESERDRRTTIMVLPLMSCGARLPIYALLVPAFFPEEYQAFTMFLIYLIGVVVALLGARLMKSTLFKGDGEVYLMELPPYRMPTFKSLMLHMWDRGRMYVQKAGTIILATSIVLYICNTYPQKQDFSKDYDVQITQQQEKMLLSDNEIEKLTPVIAGDDAAMVKENKRLNAEIIETLIQKDLNQTQQDAVQNSLKYLDMIRQLENEKMAETLEYTISGRVGKFLEPVFKPIGFDWRQTTASISALAAKEMFVAQLGILYAEGDSDEESETLRTSLRKAYTPLQAFCMMLFCLLSVPCFATLAVMKRELNSWKMMFAVAQGLLIVAYIMSLIVYQQGALLQIGNQIIG